MIYFIGGAPRAGKSILAQQISAHLRIGWVSTDLLMTILNSKNVEGTKAEWNAAPEAIAAAAEWFFPCLERFVWGVNSTADGYVIEGVDFLPDHIMRLSVQYRLRSVFLGCSKMTLDRFDRFPGRSRGYSGLPTEVRSRFAQDIPRWSEFVRQEAGRFGCNYIDMSDDFQSRLNEAEALLTAGQLPAEC
jgi:2-phosphoglycerate kinase